MKSTWNQDYSNTPERVWAYLAGIIDGEGHIGLKKIMCKASLNPTYFMSLTITNTNPLLMAWLKDNIGGNVNIDHRKGNEHRHKPSLTWYASARKAVPILERCLPFLVVKAEQAKIVLAMQSLTKGKPYKAISPEMAARRELMYLELRALNKRGPKGAEQIQ